MLSKLGEVVQQQSQDCGERGPHESDDVAILDESGDNDTAQPSGTSESRNCRGTHVPDERCAQTCQNDRDGQR